jgi:HAD superfamily hydrolase (TIGR01490 family)
MSEFPQIAPSGSAAAFFDLDRTLISGSSAFTFGVAAWRADMMTTGAFVRDGLGALAFKLLGDVGGNGAEKVRERILGAVEGTEQDVLLSLNETVLPNLLERVRPESKDLLDAHRRLGRPTYIVSAAPKEIVEPLAKALGMTDGIGTVSEIRDGRYTGALVGPFCYGIGKVEAIRSIARWEGFDLDQCYAYSDSISDLPMLEAVGHPVVVNPDSKLDRLAHQRGWPIVIFARHTKAVIRRTTAGVGAAALAGASFAAGWQVRARSE